MKFAFSEIFKKKKTRIKQVGRDFKKKKKTVLQTSSKITRVYPGTRITIREVREHNFVTMLPVGWTEASGEIHLMCFDFFQQRFVGPVVERRSVAEHFENCTGGGDGRIRASPGLAHFKRPGPGIGGESQKVL